MQQSFSHTDIIEGIKEHLLPCFHDLNEFDILFADDKLQSEMLDEIAPNFFWAINKLYFDKFMLSISRLLDPSKQSGFENLSMFKLIDIAKETQYPKLDELTAKIEGLKVKSADILKLRSKFIAHRDLNHSIKNDLVVGPIEFDSIKETFWTMAKSVNEIEIFLGMEDTSFAWFRDFYGVTALLKHLKDSLIYRDILISSDNWNTIEMEAQKSKFYNLKV